jgi:hypothetical protein
MAEIPGRLITAEEAAAQFDIDIDLFGKFLKTKTCRLESFFFDGKTWVEEDALDDWALSPQGRKRYKAWHKVMEKRFEKAVAAAPVRHLADVISAQQGEQHFGLMEAPSKDE